MGKVLLVDDDRDLRRICELSLRKVGNWTVYAAGSGAEALKIVGEIMPDLILLDVMMPQMDGPMTLKALRSSPKTANIPVIFLTAKLQDYETAPYVRMGAVGVIIKPFDPMTLPARIDSMLREKV